MPNGTPTGPLLWKCISHALLVKLQLRGVKFLPYEYISNIKVIATVCTYHEVYTPGTIPDVTMNHLTFAAVDGICATRSHTSDGVGTSEADPTIAGLTVVTATDDPDHK